MSPGCDLLVFIFDVIQIALGVVFIFMSFIGVQAPVIRDAIGSIAGCNL